MGSSSANISVLLGTFSSLENKQAVTADSVINAKLLIVAVTALQSFTGCVAEDGWVPVYLIKGAFTLINASSGKSDRAQRNSQ